MRRIQFSADSIQSKIDAFAQYTGFLRDIQNELEDRIDTELYGEGSFQTIRVFLPGSNRLVGWMDGPYVGNDIPNEDLQSTKKNLASIKKRLSMLGKRLNTAINDKQWQAKSQLKYDLELARLRFQTSKLKYMKCLQACRANSQNNADFTDASSIRHLETTNPDSDERFRTLVSAVANAEAASTQKLELTKRHLLREQNRLNSLEDLALHGHATKKEIDKLKKHIIQLRNARETVAFNLANLQQSLVGIPGSESEYDSGMQLSYLNVSQWPTEVLENATHIQYVIEQRQVCYQEIAKLNALIQRQKMFDEVIERLNIATKRFAAKNKGKGTFGELLSIGQQKELESYKWKRQTLAQSIKDSQDKIQILVLEEHRFIRQSMLMSSAAPANTKSTIVTNALSPQWLTSFVSSHGSVGSSTSQARAVRIGYIESNLLDTIGPDIELVFSHNVGYPLGFTETHEDVLQPVKLVDYSRSLNFAGRRSTKIVLNPNYSSSFGRNFGGSSYHSANRSIAAPSLYNSPYATDQYRANQFKQPRLYGNAYRFGVLRSDLRRFQYSSQSPWYLPGSPNNLRYNQLRSGFTSSSSGKTGQGILDSKNYLDLSRPNYHK